MMDVYLKGTIVLVTQYSPGKSSSCFHSVYHIVIFVTSPESTHMLTI